MTTKIAENTMSFNEFITDKIDALSAEILEYYTNNQQVIDHDDEETIFMMNAIKNHLVNSSVKLYY